MARNTNQTRVLAARLTGIAAGYGQVKRCTREEALAEIAEALRSARLPRGGGHAASALSEAAAFFVEPTGPGDAAWFPAALALLVDAGADDQVAHELRAATRSRSARLAP